MERKSDQDANLSKIFRGLLSEGTYYNIGKIAYIRLRKQIYKPSSNYACLQVYHAYDYYVCGPNRLLSFWLNLPSSYLTELF